MLNALKLAENMAEQNKADEAEEADSQPPVPPRSPKRVRPPAVPVLPNSHYTRIMEQAAQNPDAAVRFLHAVGYEEFAPQCARLHINLLTLTRMTMLDLERKLGVTNKKTVVGLYDECLKLGRCIYRSSAAIELPSWMPLVLQVPVEDLSPPDPNKARPQSARAGARIGEPRPTPPPGGGRRQRPLTASEKTRFLMSGIQAPGATSPQNRERAKEQRLIAQQQLVELQLGVAGSAKVAPEGAEPQSAFAAHQAYEARQQQIALQEKERPKRLPDPDAALAAERAKMAVMSLVGEREAALGALRSLMPAPRGVVARRRATRELIMAPGPLSEARADLAILLGEIRRTSAAICRAIFEWKLTLKARYVSSAIQKLPQLG